jgi:hypothetical protein
MSIRKLTLQIAGAILLSVSGANALPFAAGAGAVPADVSPIEPVGCVRIGDFGLCDGRGGGGTRREREERQRLEVERARQEGIESGRIRQRVMDIYKTRRQVAQARQEAFALGKNFDTYRDHVKKRAAARREQEAAYDAACSFAGC